MGRPLDKLRVEATGFGSFDRFTTFDITLDLTSPSEANFEVGDDGSWNELQDFLAMGTEYKVFLNSRTLMTGRVEMLDPETDASCGLTIRFTVRTKLTDALFASADAAIRIQNFTLKDWVLAVYAGLGYTADDFEFRANVARDLITGRPTNSSREPLVDPEEIKQDQAKVQPPESIFAAADRHLRRFGLMHWDSPDGKIIVAAPDDSQDPLYHFRNFRGPSSRINNVLSIGNPRDVSDLPSSIVVSGTSYQNVDDQYVAKKVSGYVLDPDMIAAGFHRPVAIIQEEIRSQSLANSAARRELSARSQRKDVIEILTDGLSHWDGDSLINFAPDTVADVVSDVIGGPLGPYYLHRINLTQNPNDGDKAKLSLLKQGIWRLA